MVKSKRKTKFNPCFCKVLLLQKMAKIKDGNHFFEEMEDEKLQVK